MSSHHTCLNCEPKVGKFLQRCTLGFYIEGTSLEVPMKEDIFIATNWSQNLCFWYSATDCMCPEQGTHLALHSMKENIGYIAYLTKATPVTLWSILQYTQEGCCPLRRLPSLRGNLQLQQPLLCPSVCTFEVAWRVQSPLHIARHSLVSSRVYLLLRGWSSSLQALAL